MSYFKKVSAVFITVVILSACSIKAFALEINSTAPLLQAIDVLGNKVDSEKLLKKKPVYLVFFDPYDPQVLKASQQLHDEFSKEISFIALAPAMNNNAGITQWAASSNNISYSVIFDEKNKLFRAFEGWQQPTQILIGQDGKVKFYSQQADAKIAAAIEKLTQKETK